MEAFLDTQSLSTAASSSTPHTPSPSMNDSVVPPPVDYGGGGGSGGYEPTGPAGSTTGYYLDYHQQHQHHHHHHQQSEGQQHQQTPMLSIEISHPSATAGSLYRRASFPFVQHDHSMSHYPKYAPTAHNEQLDHQDSHHQHHHSHHRDGYEYDDHPQVDHLEHHSNAMVVPTQIPQAAHNHQHPHPFYRPSSSSSSVSSVSAPPGFLNPAMSSIPVMHTDDAASKETQYLRRKCFNCGTTEPPSWRRSTLNPGKIVCNKCGLYERTHNKPRPHQFGLRPGNKTRKQPQAPQQQSNGKIPGVPSPSGSPKRHTLSIKKEQIDYSQAMRRGSIASINSGSGASDWDDHSGYSTASSAYHSSLGMAPPFGQPQQQQQQQQPHPLSHHHHHHGHGGHTSHVPSHHGHHPYNSSLSMPPPRSTSHGIRLPQAPPMKVPTGNGSGNKAGSSSPIAGPAVNTSVTHTSGGNNSHSNLPHIHTTGNPRHSSSPDNMTMLSPSALAGSPYGPPGLSPSLPNSTMPSSLYSPGTALLRGPPQAPPTADYYARRGSTSQIPHHHHASSLYHEDMATMRRGSVGAIGMGGPPPPPPPSGMTYGGGGLAQRGLPPPSSWQQQQQSHYHQSSAGVPLAEMSLTPTPAPGGNGNGSGSCNSAGSTPQQGYANVVHNTSAGSSGGAGGDMTPSPPHGGGMNNMNNMLRGSGSGSAGASPIGASMPPEITSLTA